MTRPTRFPRCLGARQLLDHALAGPLPLLQEDQEIGHLLPVRPLVELPDDVGADLAGRGQDPKEIPTRRWSERVGEASRILPKHRCASVSVAGPKADHATGAYISTEAGWSKTYLVLPIYSASQRHIELAHARRRPLSTRSRVDRPSSDSHHRPMCSEAAGRHMLRRALAWSAALCALGLGCLAALVGALDTRRVCVGILDSTCDGPNWGEALVAFGLACALLTVGVVLVVRLRRGAQGRPRRCLTHQRSGATRAARRRFDGIASSPASQRAGAPAAGATRSSRPLDVASCSTS